MLKNILTIILLWTPFTRKGHYSCRHLTSQMAPKLRGHTQRDVRTELNLRFVNLYRHLWNDSLLVLYLIFQTMAHTQIDSNTHFDDSLTFDAIFWSTFLIPPS
jgi:hypothetical protein